MHTAVETMVDSSAAQVGILRIGWEVSKGLIDFLPQVMNLNGQPFFQPDRWTDYSANEGEDG